MTVPITEIFHDNFSQKRFRISQKYLFEIFFLKIWDYILKENKFFPQKVLCFVVQQTYPRVASYAGIRYRNIVKTEIFGMEINDKQFLYTKK